MDFRVTTEPTEEPITLIEAKLAARIDASADDDLVTRLIIAARERAEQITGAALARKTITVLLPAWPAEGDVVLPRPPLATISSVKYIDADGALQTIDSANYVTSAGDHTRARLLPVYDYEWPDTRDVYNAVQIVYTTGYTQALCPASVKMYVAATVAAMYAQREAIADASRAPVAVALYDGLLDDHRIYS